jgi:pimeloyl-ACP methyl ester carboxylesterase
MRATAPAVILIHGLWTGPWAMVWLARRMKAAGMRPYRFGYPSVRRSLNANAAALADFARTIDAPELHWLGHSLGGMLILRTLQRGDFPSGRVVMPGAPCHRPTHAGAQRARLVCSA